jgi:glycosyltransferase involved in cell wall biosynthesis
MRHAIDERKVEVIRQGIAALLADIDTEIQSLASDPDESGERLERLSRLMIDPPFLKAIGRDFDLPSPAVSIIMPTRNRAQFIGEAIASVQAQSVNEWELIIVDDGGNDNTPKVVAAFSADRRVRYVFQVFSGHAVARNHAFRLSKAPYIAYLDSDNLWYPNFLKAAVAMLASHPGVDCVYGALDTEIHRSPRRTILFEEFDWDRVLRANYIDLNTVVHRRALMNIHGVFDESLDRLVDWDLLLRFTKDKPAYRVPVLATRYRIVDEQRVSATRPWEPNYETIQRKWRSEVT